MGAHRSGEARAFAALGLAAIAVAGCGGGTRQDANEPSGNFPVDVLSASFPDQQRLATTSDMIISVRNAGTKKVPNISVTVKCYPGRNGKLPRGSLGTYDQAAGGGFGYRSTYPGNADPSPARTRWQGMNNPIGFRPTAPPVARAAPGLPAIRASRP